MLTQKADRFCHQLGIRLPIIQAPMAGGMITAAFIREIAEHGGLGSLPLGYLSPDATRRVIRETKALTAKPFAVNLFVSTPIPQPFPQQTADMLAYINQHRSTLGLPALTAITPWAEPDMEELSDMIMAEGVSIVSFTFGILPVAVMQRLREKNVFLMGTATTVQEGLALEAAGCHAVIAQGYEAGGHRGGGFLETHPGGLIGTMALVPLMVDALKIPVIAAGGIMDGRGIAAALTLGASAVQMGTAFLTCIESNASALHKRMLLESPAESTCITSAFTGKPVRGFHNAFVNMTEKTFSASALLPYPLQHQLTQELRREANARDHLECAGLWSGQGFPLARVMTAAQLMSTLEKETLHALSCGKAKHL